jgi:aryl-alcohol dehydrogenase-like predicted oxidoreductase
MGRVKHLEENMAAASIELTQHDFDSLDGMAR